MHNYLVIILYSAIVWGLGYCSRYCDDCMGSTRASEFVIAHGTLKSYKSYSTISQIQNEIPPFIYLLCR